MQYIKRLASFFIIALSFLTVIPIPFLNKINYDQKNISRSLIFYPLVGLFFGIITFFSVKFLLFFKINISIAGLTIIFLPYLLNKFLHFDGLCDTIDAFLPFKTKEERLEILKDTNIGSYAIGIAILFVLIKLEIVKLFLNKNDLLPLLIIIPVLSRYSLVFLSFISKYPRKQGTGFNIIGQISFGVFFISTVFFILIIFTFLFIFMNLYNLINILILIIFIYTFSFLFKIYSTNKISGVTGDILGAQNELIELFSFIIIIILSNTL